MAADITDKTALYQGNHVGTGIALVASIKCTSTHQ
jgi:hypothetical protein